MLFRNLTLNIRTRLYEWRTRHDFLSVQMRRMFQGGGIESRVVRG